MDRRTQRYIFLVVFFCVALVLYKSLGSGENAVRQTGVDRWAASSELDLRGLQAANSTLGVRHALHLAFYHAATAYSEVCNANFVASSVL